MTRSKEPFNPFLANKSYPPVTSLLLGVAIGDALGVPFEFQTREEMNDRPAVEMVGDGAHGQPAGTWSDDTSLTLCLAESLLDGYNLESMATRFVRWKNEAYWTARDEVFDIGSTTAISIIQLREILESGEINRLKCLIDQADEMSNGNGSLMRISPLLFEIMGKTISDQYKIVGEVSGLTHRHIRAAMCCMFYLKVAEYLYLGENKKLAYQRAVQSIRNLWELINYPQPEQLNLSRLMGGNLVDLEREEISSSGYVVHTLEAALWCFLNGTSARDCLLRAVNLGDDTDTVAAVVGGWVGLYYGAGSIPENWIANLARVQDIIELGQKLDEKYATTH